MADNINLANNLLPRPYLPKLKIHPLFKTSCAIADLEEVK